jgi:hypothetical protein
VILQRTTPLLLLGVAPQLFGVILVLLRGEKLEARFNCPVELAERPVLIRIELRCVQLYLLGFGRVRRFQLQEDLGDELC